jgi:Tfp pilus assembly protein FimT
MWRFGSRVFDPELKLIGPLTMPRNTPNANTFPRRQGGFTTIELLIVATLLAVVTAFGVIGISKARASVRLSGAAREYASYIEKARIFSIKSHADDAAERATITINADKSSYDVTMDLDGDGAMDTRTVSLPSGITFETVESIGFDWRGRTVSLVGGVTTPNAQVSIRLQSSDDSISIDVTGSGDVTIDSQVFDDSVPNVSLKIGDLASGATPVPGTPSSGTSPSASPSPTVAPVDSSGSTPSPTPIVSDGSPVATPTPSATPTPTPISTPTPSPSPVATPSPSPIVPCTITTDQSLVTMLLEGTATIKVSHSSTTSVSVSASSSKASDLQVTPGGNQTIGSGSTTTFTLKSKKSAGSYSVTFTAGCGSKTVPVIVAAL